MKVRVYRHAFGGEPPQLLEVECLAEWLMERYADKPRPQIFVGEPSLETEITTDVQAILRADAPEYTVLESPGGDPITWAAIGDYVLSAAIGMAVSAALQFIMAKPDPEDNLNRAQESPNNQLSARENRVRLLERVEDIYGTVRSIPSLMMAPYTKYIDHLKVEYGYYCPGRGYLEISDIRDGDTLLSEVNGASAAVYAPFTSPNSGGAPQLLIGSAIIDDIVSAERSNSVDGITLKAANQLQLTAGQYYEFYGPGPGKSGYFGATSRDVIWQPSHLVGPYNARRPNFAAVCVAGQTLTISHSNVTLERKHGPGDSFSATAATSTFSTTATGFFRGVVDGSSVVSAGWTDPANNGTFTVVSHTDDSIVISGGTLVNETLSVSYEVTFTVVVNYSASRTIYEVANGYVMLDGPAQFSTDDQPAGGAVNTIDGGGILADIAVVNGLVEWTDWITLPNTDRTEVWANTIARNGVYKDDGAKSDATVAYEFQIEQLDSSLVPLGVVETVTGSLSGATSNERAETLERTTAWTGPARFRARRTTPFDYDFQGAVVDEIQLVDLYSVSPVSKTHFGNKTTIHTVTRANQDASALKRRELNCLASRKLPTYNGTTFSGAFDATGLLVSGTIAATSKMVDIIAAVAVDPKIGNMTLATDVDMAQIWSVQQDLDAWNTECGQFNYTFDSDTLSLEETVSAVAQAVFCAPYRQNGKIRLALDRPQTTSTALFTHRNKKPNAETITRRFASDSEYDGVELVYQDPDADTRETIRLPLGGSATKYKKVEATGIRSFRQAWFRANREYNRLRYQRMSIETDTTTDGRALLPNSRIDVVDNTRFKSYDGEVVAQSGLTLTLSRDVAFLPATPHSIVLMKRDGSLQSIACTEVSGSANKVLLANLPAEAIVTTQTKADGIRTIFSFAADSARAAQAWLVQEIDTTDGQYVRVRAINYSSDYYAADSQAVPAKAGVIND